MTVHSSEGPHTRRRALTFAGAMALLGAAGIVVLSGAPALAEGEPGAPSGGDGSLHLLADVIVNSGIESGNSTDFPFTGQLFLPQVAQRAEELERARDATAQAAARLTFEGHADTFVADGYRSIRDTLFDGYSPAAVRSVGSDTATTDADPWILLMAVVALPLTGLAVYLGAKSGARRRRARA